MTTETATISPSGGADTSPGKSRNSELIRATWFFTAAMIALIALFFPTWRTMVQTWIGVDTYNYGLFVPVISIALIVRLRKKLQPVLPAPTGLGIGAIFAATCVWAIGDLAGVLVLKQFAVLAMIPASVLAIFGKQITRLILFPIFFLLFALPVGEFLIPALITWTADFSVLALEVIGVPVFRDGPYIRIPAGDFHVVKACSGIRYLLTSIVLGALFSYLSFRSWQRRFAFLGLCIVAPIIANWIRATCIILIGHLSNMKLAAGVDHFIYGWIFFGVVMLIIFLIGNMFRDGDFTDISATPAAHGVQSGDTAHRWSVPGAFLAVLATATAGVWVSAAILERAHGDNQNRVANQLPSAGPGWEKRDGLSRDWNPVFVGAHSIRKAEYDNGVNAVSAALVFYDRQMEGAELISAQNSLYEPVQWWTRFDSQTVVNSESADMRLLVREVSVNDGQTNRLIWSWYSIAGTDVANELLAKVRTFAALMAGEGSGAFLVALTVDYDEDIEIARQALQEFLVVHYDRISDCLAVDAGERCE